MNARFAPVVSRLRIVSLALVSTFAVAACNGRASTTTQAPAPAAQAEQAAPAATEHGPGNWMFRQVQALDLRTEQRASLNEIEQNLRADLAPHKETLRQLVQALADGIEAGKLDPADAAAHQAALKAAAAEAKASVQTAMNAVHDTLSIDQRVALVTRLDQQRQGRVHDAADAPNNNGPLAKLALELGMTDEQKAALREAVQQGVDDIIPNHKAQREAHEARMRAMADAFVSDNFDAIDFDPAADSEHSIESFALVAQRAIEASERILTVSQRQALASLIRQHAAKL
jgi:Spy/CpxP family protein refolding chaperone